MDFKPIDWLDVLQLIQHEAFSTFPKVDSRLEIGGGSATLRFFVFPHLVNTLEFRTFIQAFRIPIHVHHCSSIADLSWDMIDLVVNFEEGV